MDPTAQLVAAADAAEAELEGATDLVFVKSRRQAEDPCQVYSVRIPVQHVARLRQVADGLGVSTDVLMRRWVLERLASEDPAADAPGD